MAATAAVVVVIDIMAATAAVVVVIDRMAATAAVVVVAVMVVTEPAVPAHSDKLCSKRTSSSCSSTQYLTVL